MKPETMCVCIAMTALAGAAWAGPVTLDATSRGHVKGASAGYVTNGSLATNNYFAGKSGGTEIRNWFVFDLSGIVSPIVGAELRLNAALILSDDPFETYNVTSTTSSVVLLEFGVGGSAVFDSLGTGSLFSSINVVDGVDDNTMLTLSLNAAGLAHINANLGGKLAFSGRLTTLDASASEYVFAGSYAKITQLHLLDNPVIPLPTGAAMAMVGMGVIGVRRRRAIGS